MTVFGFDLSPDKSEGYGSGTHVNPIQQGSLRFELLFKSPLAYPVTILVYCEFDNTIEISSNGEIITDYS